VDANRNAAVTGARELPGKVNYFIDNDPKKWRTNVPTYAEVKYKDIYPGVDLVFYGNQQQLEHDFVVAPGADVDRIALRLEGSKKVSLDAKGNLVMTVEGREVQLQRPLIYQEGSDGHREISGGYVVNACGEVTFKVGDYDATKPLMIDPVLAYSTYLGGSSYDGATAIAVDSSGNAYVTGETDSMDFPTTAGALQGSYASEYQGYNAFVAKLNPAGSALVYSTYLGGCCDDHGTSIAVDSGGDAHVSGFTASSDFPTTAGAFQTSVGTGAGYYHAFVTKLNSGGSALVYSTYLGGERTDFGNSLALDALGNAFVTGFTESSNFPTTAGTFQTSLAGTRNAFITKLNPGGSALAYSTFLGGSGYDEGYGIAVDTLGNTYVTGFATSADFPTTSGAFQTSLAGSQNAFITKLNPGGSALVYSTYLGGSGDDEGAGVVVDSLGNAFVTGDTLSSNFPTTVQAFQTIYGGSDDAFVTKLNPSGSSLVYSTYLGGSGYDYGVGIALDSSGNAYVTGGTTSGDFPATQGAFQTSLPGSRNAFFAILDPGGSALAYSTFLGGSGSDEGEGVAVDTPGNAYVTGATASSNFPTTAGAFQTSLAGTANAFVAKFSTPPGWQQVPGSLSQVSVGSDGTVWGINSAGQIYMFNPLMQTWVQAPGLLTQIAVGSSGVIWGLNAAGQIFRYDPASQSWDQIPGILSQIAVGSDGDVWGVNTSGQVYHFDSSQQNWVEIPGALAQIAVGYDGVVWGINSAQQVYRFNPGTQNWQQVAGLLKQVAVGGDGDVWSINSAGQTYHFNTLSQQWQNTGASLAQLAVGSASNVWGLDSAGGVWNYNGQAQAWNQVPGQLLQIAVGENGAVWGVNSANQIYQFLQPTQPTQTFHQVPGVLAQVVAAIDGEVWGINAAGQIWRYDAQHQSWEQIPGALTQISVGFGGNVWGLNAAGEVWQFNPSTQGWNQIAGSLVQIAVADGSVWGLNSAGQIWRFNPATQGWDSIPGALAQLVTGADGTVWGINSAGQIWQFDPSTQGWDQIPGNMVQIAVGSANNVWGINSAGQVCRYEPQLPIQPLLQGGWECMPEPPVWSSVAWASVAVAFDGTVWGLNSAQQVWRFNAQKQSWDSIAGQLTQISVGADAVVWGVNASGQTYQYW
jgi:hypothetical protein